MGLLGGSNTFFLPYAKTCFRNDISALCTAHNDSVQPKLCVKVVEPHEDNLEILNDWFWAPSKTAKLLWKYLDIYVVIYRAVLRS